MSKTWKLFWGIGFILLAVALVLDAVGVLSTVTGVVGEVSILAIVAGLLLICFSIARLCRGKVGDIFVPLALIFMLFEKNIAYVFHIGDENGNIINNWLLLLCAVLVWIGFSILFSGIRIRRKKKEFDFCSGSGNYSNIGSAVKYIDCENFKYESIENHLGTCTVFFENIDKYEGGGVLALENNLGTTTVNVPKDWRVVMDIHNSLGHGSAPTNETSGPLLIIKGENNLGSVNVKRV